MVVNIDSNRFGLDRSHVSTRASHRAEQPQRDERASQCVTIGLVNNMAGTAFKATERQFVSLLDSASDGIPIHVSFYTLPGLSQAESGGHHFASHYASVDALWDTHLDGLIVTGREPKKASLRDEPYWESFTHLLEWARGNTHSAVWSCLAAHAAILHMDGIGRRKSHEKNFGIFECAQVSPHPLTHNLPPRFHVPHSRWNGVAQEDLTASGYTVLSQIVEDGVDTFVKQEQSLFVFFQGHLEYEADTLMREYRRDVGRYLKGESHVYPPLPHGYFDSATEAELRALREEAIAHRRTALLTRVAAAIENAQVQIAWQSSAAVIYRNWLQLIVACKSGSRHAHRAVAALSASR